MVGGERHTGWAVGYPREDDLDAVRGLTQGDGPAGFCREGDDDGEWRWVRRPATRGRGGLRCGRHLTS